MRQLIITVIAVGVTSLVGYWAYTTDVPGTITRPVQTEGKRVADFFIKGAHVTEYGTTGTLDSTLLATEINHYPDDNNTLLSRPMLWMYGQNHQPWQTTADQGRILPDGETVELIDNVVMVQDNIAGTEGQRVETNFLTVYSGQDYADTDQPVRLTNPENTVNAVGMRVFYRRDFIQLKSRVDSIHEID